MGIRRKFAYGFGILILLLLIIGVLFSSLLPISFDRSEFTNGYELEEVYPSLDFNSLVGLYHQGSDRMYAVEQSGKIYSFDSSLSDPVATLLLDLTAVVNFNGEMGLLGLAFHPDFISNGKFYVNYNIADPLRTLVSEFILVGDTVDPISERIILEIDQPYANHNGGTVVFGHDGFLYISLGDGGLANDPNENGQNSNTLLGSILRIDVNGEENGKNYRIPLDNPFTNDTSKKAEIFAYGLRNTWKFSVDSLTGEIWGGDVGQNSFEEVNLIKKGENYGWNTMEGFACFDPDEGCDQSGLTLPVVDYGRDLGKSITGGFVYRGANLPDLVGRYIFGDYISGRIWSIDASNPDTPDLQDMMKYNINVSSFAQDKDGEVYVLNYDGTIYRIIEE